jgi:diguanylate cyclase (GGDEF)-like protein/putative nucleotidyltransferase with HDIG domain
VEESQRENYIKLYQTLLILLGLGVIGLAAGRVLSQAFDWRWLVLAILALVGSWLAASQLPGAKNIVTVSDAFVFLTALLGGPDAAILVAAITAAGDSARFVKRWVTFATNVSVICISFFVSGHLTVLAFGDLQLLAHQSRTFFLYALALGTFAALQATINLLLVSGLSSLTTRTSIRLLWDANYSWVAASSFSGAVTAGVVNALIHYYGFPAVGFTAPVLLANYLICRPYLKNIESARRHIEEIRALHLRTLEAFAIAVDAKDQITHEHVHRVQVYAEGLAGILGLSEAEIDALRAGALLHDIGKIAVPDYILNKPGKLTAAEFDKMKIHTIVGAQILERINFPYPLVPVVRHHHERWDGKGYPDGLKGEEIPLTARILAVVDCFDAVREDRQYRKGLTREQAIELLKKDRGTHFDPRVVDLFIEHLPQFEAQIAKLKRGQPAFTPLELEESEAIRTAVPAAGLASENDSTRQVEYLQTIRAAQRANQEIFALYEIAQTFTSSLDVSDTLAVVVNKLQRIIPFETCVVYLYDQEQLSAIAHQVVGLHSESFRGRAVRPGEGVTGWVLANKRPFANTDPALDLAHLGERATSYRTLAVYPLGKGERHFGALAVYSQTLPAYSDDQLRTLERVASLTSDALYNATLYAESRTSAWTDSLTGLPNGRFLYAFFEQEKARCAEDEHPLTLLTMDLDGFKQVNATVGHKQGDEILKEVADLIRLQLRRDDMLIRHAGDEFIALLRDASSAQVKEITARIRAAVEQHQPGVPIGNGITLSISIGQARLGNDGVTLGAILDAAEARLQSDKSARRASPRSAVA